MTPAEFCAAYRPTADHVQTGTGIDAIALLAQWANETSWGVSWAGAPFNLANIEDGAGHVLQMASLNEFATICINTFHNGLYQPVLDAKTAVDQLAAIVASPWAAGHYGGSLLGFYAQVEDFELTGDEHNTLYAIQSIVDGINRTTLGRIETEVLAIKAAVAGLTVGSSALTPAQAQLLQDAHDAIARIEASLKAA